MISKGKYLGKMKKTFKRKDNTEFEQYFIGVQTLEGSTEVIRINKDTRLECKKGELVEIPVQPYYDKFNNGVALNIADSLLFE